MIKITPPEKPDRDADREKEPNMLFSKEIEPRCAYCRRGARLDDENVMCVKKGVVAAGGQCRRFRYDPLKRVPPRPAPLDLSRFSEEDFTL